MSSCRAPPLLEYDQLGTPPRDTQRGDEVLCRREPGLSAVGRVCSGEGCPTLGHHEERCRPSCGHGCGQVENAAVVVRHQADHDRTARRCGGPRPGAARRDDDDRAVGPTERLGDRTPCGGSAVRQSTTPHHEQAGSSGVSRQDRSDRTVLANDRDPEARRDRRGRAECPVQPPSGVHGVRPIVALDVQQVKVNSPVHRLDGGPAHRREHAQGVVDTDHDRVADASPPHDGSGGCRRG